MATETDPQTTPTRTETLELSLFPDRPAVRIDGHLYGLRTPSDLSIAGYKRFERLSSRMSTLLSKAGSDEDMTSQEEAELSQHMDTLCRVALDAPDTIHSRLGDVHRLKLLEAFMPLLSSSLQTVGARQGGGRSHGAKSSRGSNGSTAGTRSPGSRRSRSESSRRTS